MTRLSSASFVRFFGAGAVACNGFGPPVGGSNDGPRWIAIESPAVSSCSADLRVEMLSEEVSRQMMSSRDLSRRPAGDLPASAATFKEIALFANRAGESLGMPAAYNLSAEGPLVNLCAPGVRLPTPAEWLAGVTAGPTRESEWCRTDNFADASLGILPPLKGAKLECSDGFSGVAPTDAFPPNEKGFRNMGGNVLEAVQHLGRRDPFTGREWDQIEFRGPLEAGEGPAVALMGANYMISPHEFSTTPEFYPDDGAEGFRLVRVLDDGGR
jgi:hypothetical protein